MVKRSHLDRVRILVLSDLHYATDTGKWEEVFATEGTRETAAYSFTNIERLLGFILNVVKRELDHVIILGDLTLLGSRDDFKLAKEDLLRFQEELKNEGITINAAEGELDPAMFTIIPGNHDLNEPTVGKWTRRRRMVTGGMRSLISRVTKKPIVAPPSSPEKMSELLQLFREYFGETLWDRNQESKQFGSLEKILRHTNVSLVPLNSCVPAPVHLLGINARGRIDQDQRVKYTELGRNGNGPRLRIALAHHFPLPIPVKRDSLTEPSLELEDASDVIHSLYGGAKFAAFLCGHKHSDFIWCNIAGVPKVDRCMPIICVGTHYLSGTSPRSHLLPDRIGRSQQAQVQR